MKTKKIILILGILLFIVLLVVSSFVIFYGVIIPLFMESHKLGLSFLFSTYHEQYIWGIISIVVAIISFFILNKLRDLLWDFKKNEFQT